MPADIKEAKVTVTVMAMAMAMAMVQALAVLLRSCLTLSIDLDMTFRLRVGFRNPLSALSRLLYNRTTLIRGVVYSRDTVEARV